MCEGQCGAILKTGPNKGQRCGNYSTKGKGLCGVHQRSARKNKVVPLPVMYVVPGFPVEQYLHQTPLVKDDCEMEVSEKNGLRRWMCM
jgi:hypothetical protein